MKTPERFGTLYGDLTPKSVPAIIRWFERMAERKPEHVHVIYSVPGGEVDAGIALHDFFEGYSATMPFTLYANCAKSSGAVAFLGAKNRKVAPHGSFMVHGVVTKFPNIPSIDELRQAIRAATFDDDRVKAVIQKHLKNIKAADWKKYRAGEWRLTTDELVSKGVIGSTADCVWCPKVPEGAAMEVVSIA